MCTRCATVCRSGAPEGVLASFPCRMQHETRSFSSDRFPGRDYYSGKWCEGGCVREAGGRRVGQIWNKTYTAELVAALTRFKGQRHAASEQLIAQRS
eukprot:359427-Chlamydomonas_euryale.AAC.1